MHFIQPTTSLNLEQCLIIATKLAIYKLFIYVGGGGITSNPFIFEP